MRSSALGRRRVVTVTTEPTPITRHMLPSSSRTPRLGSRGNPRGWCGGGVPSPEFVMPLTPDARRARARLAAHRRWRPGDDLDALTDECYREIELSKIDDGIDDLTALAPRM